MKKTLKIFIKPGPNPLKPGGFLHIRDPDTFVPLSVDGEFKVLGSYWMRRIKDGDVLETKPPSKKATPKKKVES